MRFQVSQEGFGSASKASQLFILSFDVMYTSMTGCLVKVKHLICKYNNYSFSP